MTALCGVCASGADAADSQLADAGAKFEFLFSWYRVKDEASAKDFSEIGVTDIIAGGSKGVAAAKKYGLVPYCTFMPVGPHKQVLRAEEQKLHDFINGVDLRGRLPKEELRRILDERRKAVGCRFGGEPSEPLDLCATLIDCFLSDTNCILAKAEIDRTLAANPGTDCSSAVCACNSVDGWCDGT